MTFEDEDQVYRKHADALIRYATVLVGPDRAHDAVADAVVGVLNNGGLADVDNAKAYLFRAVHNASVAIHTRTSRRERREIAAEAVATVGSLGEANLDVVAVVAGLSPRQRSVVWLTYWEDLPPRAVAATLGISEGSVKRHLARARVAVRKAIQ